MDSEADAISIDLEDAVAESAKPDARIMVHDNLKAFTGANRPWVRINPIDTPHALPDLAAIVRARPGGIMLHSPGLVGPHRAYNRATGKDTVRYVGPATVDLTARIERHTFSVSVPTGATMATTISSDRT